MKAGFGRGPSQVPPTVEERGYWAIQRVLDAARLVAKHPDDRAYVIAVGSRVREYDEISTAEERRLWLHALDQHNRDLRKAAQNSKRGRPRKVIEEVAELLHLPEPRVV